MLPGMATTTKTRQRREATRVTFAEAILAPVAGALVGYATFGVLATILAAVVGSSAESFRVPADNWKEVGFGAAVLAGTLLFVGYLYGGFVAGRLAGAGRMGRTQGLLVFVAGVGLAILAGTAISWWTDGKQAEELARALRTFGVPGSGAQWRQIGTATGICSLAGMLFGSYIGGQLAELKLERSRPARS